MKATDIRVGMTLKLKPARREAYGKTTPFVRVDAIKPHKQYVTPWIVQADESYRPSDFEREARP